jgi:hypothetical protein
MPANQATDERAMELHCARVWLAESRRCTNHRFRVALLTWAGDARRRAMNPQLPLLRTSTRTCSDEG